MKIYSAALVAMAGLFAATPFASAQDAKKGMQVFNQCKACHALDKALVGPPLKGVVGRKAGSVAGYSYSPLMKAASEAGVTWSAETLVDYLKNPTEYLKKEAKGKGSGSSKMSYMLGNEQQRKDVVAYLAEQK